jgi:hypothetical protein
MLKRIGWIFVVALSLLTSGVVWSQAPKQGATKAAMKAAFLPVGVKGLSAEQAKTLAATILAELGEIGVFDIVSNKTLYAEIDKLKKKKIYQKDCDEKKACLQAIGKAVKAGVLFHLQVTKGPDGVVTLTMQALDAKAGKQARKGTESSTEDPADLERAARWVTRSVSSSYVTQSLKGKGKLQVDSEEADAELFVNGKSFGKKIGKSFKVTSGVFDIVVKKDGFSPFHDVVVIRPNQVAQLKASMKAKEAPKPPVVAEVTPVPKKEGETAAAIPPPIVPPSTTPATPPEKKAEPPPAEKKELPPWAIFDKGTQKAPEPEKSKDGVAQAEKKAETFPWQAAKKEEPYLPKSEEKKAADEGTSSRDKKFYQTWWFWTTVGVLVAGGGAATYLLVGSGGGGAGSGNAVITWQ